MQRVLLEEFTDANLNILIVWANILAADSLAISQETSKLFEDDPRVTQFYDPAKMLAKAVAEGLGAQAGETAWDVYLFYDTKTEWGKRVPQPKDWVHQLVGSRWAEAARRFQGDRLAKKLHEITLSLHNS